MGGARTIERGRDRWKSESSLVRTLSELCDIVFVAIKMSHQ